MSPAIPDRLFELDSDSSANLQSQIQEMLVKAILDGQIPAGSAMPSGRKLAEQLKVARNTVVLVYQRLVDEGFLVARERSGYFVSDDILLDRLSPARQTRPAESVIDWGAKLRFQPTLQRNLSKPSDWSRYPYPFIYGQIDPNLFPVNEWRECCRDAATVGAIRQWSTDRIDQDDPELIEQIQSRILPRRGVWAHPDEILVTLGAQQALYIIADLLLDEHQTVAIEEPGYPDARNIFLSRTARLKPIQVDHEGLIPTDELAQCQCLYLTPSHQFPTTVTLSRRRRETLLEAARDDDFVIIEDDYESEHNFKDGPTPALKSLDRDGVVIYIGSLSKTLAPGLRVGFMTGPARF
ncbi:MAG: PLP-dependent aminotransferase family protein, partial [Arenicellales bacterium]